jgi:hypothetical protein
MDLIKLNYYSDLFVKIAASIDFFVDFDETLITTVDKKEQIPEGVEYCKMYSGVFVIKRPGTDQFLSWLKNYGKIYICSHNNHSFINEALHKLRLLPYFSGIYAREEVWNRKKLHDMNDFILIDNLPKESRHSTHKLNYLSDDHPVENNNDYVQVPEFTGEPDDVFPAVAAQIKEMISRPIS